MYQLVHPKPVPGLTSTAAVFHFLITSTMSKNTKNITNITIGVEKRGSPYSGFIALASRTADINSELLIRILPAEVQNKKTS